MLIATLYFNSLSGITVKASCTYKSSPIRWHPFQVQVDQISPDGPFNIYQETKTNQILNPTSSLQSRHLKTLWRGAGG